ncbi:MAG: VCBS repeat-containing protein [Phycisphaerae bacterium]|nr:VCBS repeat-containing protein [Phycisphaerae bacterium]
MPRSVLALSLVLGWGVAGAFAAPPTLEGVSWAIEYNGQVYHGIDVFAKFTSPNQRLLNVFNTNVQLSAVAGANFRHVPHSNGELTSEPGLFEDDEEAVTDTYVCIGGSQQEDQPFFSFDPSCPHDIFVTSASITTAGGWFNVPPTDGIQTAGDDLRVRIARYVLDHADYVGGAHVDCSWKLGWVEAFGSPAQFVTPSGTFWFTDAIDTPPVDEPGQDFWFDAAGGCPPSQGPSLPPAPEPFGSLLNKSIIWTTPGGWVVGWEVNGLTYVNAESLTATQPLNTVAAGAPDLDGDGDQDLLWRNPTTQNVIGCIVQDGVVLTTASIGTPQTPVNDWELLGQIDMTGDGRQDMVWRNIDGGLGSVRVWQMNGLTREANVQIGVSPGFEFLGLVDLNTDGKGDVLWRLANGSVMAWLGNGLGAPTTKMFTGAGPIAPTWKFLGAPDLDGDGDTDFLWHNLANGNVNGWIIQGTAKVSGGLVAPAVGPQWTLTDIVDLDADGDDDVIWRNTLFNSVNGWRMQGLVKQAGAAIKPVSDGWAIMR